jgi:hypothetical protein
MTPDQIRAFQASNRNPQGKPLDVDGDLGPETAWALGIAALGEKRQAIVCFHLDHVGKVFENGDNRHPLIDLWLLRCGVPVGLAWCAAYASAAVSAAPGLNLHEASVARLSKLLPHTDCPQPGDLGYYLNADGTGHVFLVIGVGPTTVMTGEGNQRNGCRTLRRVRSQLRFLQTVPTAGVLPVEFATGGTR